MTKWIITLLMAVPFIVCGQTLTLEQLLKFQKSDFVTVNDILTSKGWEFSHSEKGVSLDKGAVTWTFEKNAFSEAKGSLTLSTTEVNGNNVSYQTYNSKIYNSIKARMNAYKMKLIGNYLMDNEIMSIYQGQKHTVLVSIGSSDDNSATKYTLTLMTNNNFSSIVNLMKKIIQEKNDTISSDTANIKHD